MPKFRHATRGTVVTTSVHPGAGWELADSPPVPDKAPESKKAPAKKTVKKAVPAADDKE